jgi:murein DD-endopeptidase MepM/ murein hydrolase activator NlpD
MPVILILFSLIFCSCSSTPRLPAGTPHFMWPVKGGRITQKFKPSLDRHDGLDIAARTNTPIYAAETGRVLYAGHDFTGYGNLIIIEHRGDAWASFYAHLHSFKVREGDLVRKGQKIGGMGRTGRATGVHLHFEIRRDLRPVNPLHYLGPPQYLTTR